jgi:hypothetical protein
MRLSWEREKVRKVRVVKSMNAKRNKIVLSSLLCKKNLKAVR